MPTPFPAEGDVDLTRPSQNEVALLSRGILSAAAPDEGPSAIQAMLLDALVPAMTEHPAVQGAPLSARGLGDALARRNRGFRTRIVQLMVLLALVLRPLPEAVAARVTDYARELGVDEGQLEVTRRFAAGSLGLAAFDFERNGYTADWTEADAGALHASGELSSAWDLVVDDPRLHERWRALEALPAGSLGRRVSELYRARGFAYPGGPGSAPPLLAQHDWVHVLADFGTTVECELEVFAFIARANDDPRAFSLLAMVVSLFETGYLRTGAGLFQADTGHLSRPGMSLRLADAMRRGALCTGSLDFLRMDWFELAARPVDDIRRQLGVGAKAPAALAAGSVGPWEPGGISAFQARAGHAQAEAEGRPYETFGAVVEPEPPSSGS
jgi:hypothetical protein